MDSKELPYDLWSLILPYLARPVPPPLSRPDRSALRQPDLVAALRCCRLLKEIATPLLYSTIVTDTLPSLIETITQPSALQRFSHTRHLYIEYSPRGREPTYLQLLSSSRSSPVWTQYALDQEAIAKEVKAELRAYTVCVEALKQKGMREVFPRLETMAIASIYGVETNAWRQYEQELVDYAHTDTPQRQSSLAVFLRSGTLRHLCMRNPHGPLSIGRVTFTSLDDEPIDYTQTIHFGAQLDYLPLTLGKHISWVSDVPMSESFFDVLHCLGRTILGLIDFHKMVLPPAAAKRIHLPDTADVDIYFSTNTYRRSNAKPENLAIFGLTPPPFDVAPFTPPYQKALTARMGAAVQAAFRRVTQLEDSFRFHPSSATPICQACGSGPPAGAGE